MIAKLVSEPLIIIGLYFLLVLAIGIFSSFRIKNTGDFYIAGKKGGLVQISGSLFATIVGASALLGTFEFGQKEGWPAVWFLICGALGLFILIPLTKKVSRYGHFTLPELLGRFYGEKAGIAASIIIPVAWTGVIAAQIIAAAKIMDSLNLLEYESAAFLTGGIFIAYTLIGGQISVIRTDVFQAILIYAGLLIIFFSATGTANNEYKASLVPEGLFTGSFTPLDLLILLLTYSVTFVVGPDIYSRIFCAKTARVASSSVFIVAILLIPVGYIMTYLGITSHHYTAAGHTFGLAELGKNLLPMWAFGIFIAALLSAVMSSASATLLTSATILSGLTSINLNEKRSIYYTRIFVILVGILSIVISLWVSSIIESLLLALSFFSGACVIPVLAGLLNMKVNQSRVLMAIISGGTIALAGKIIQIYIAGLPGNLLIIASYFVNAFLLFSPDKFNIYKRN